MLKSRVKYEEEPMDTNEVFFGDYEEEGEIRSSDDERNIQLIGQKEEGQSTKSVPVFGGISSDANESEELKRLQRAKRFAIPLQQSGVISVNSENISRLHKSLGIDKENEKHYRFNAIHMRGTEDMSSEDVLEYFSSFAPSHLEWINDVSCNVLWTDDISAAKAMLNLSKEIKNLDKVHLNANPFQKDLKEEHEEMECSTDSEAVDAREINAAIPPGFWRIGVPSKKSQTILLRLATRSDRKQKNAEKNSEYYKRYGNPHFGNIPGIVSNSMRSEVFKKFRKFHNNNDSEGKNGRKNPWGYLAEEWSKLDKPKEDARSKISLKRQNPSQREDLRLSINNKHKRLKAHTEHDHTSSQFVNNFDNERGKFPKMKMYADEEQKNEVKSSKNKISSQIRVPVMEDLRYKIDRRRRTKKMLYKERNSNKYWKKCNSTEEDDDYDEEEKGSTWALEQYSDLRESLEQNKKCRNINYTRTFDKSDSDDVSDEIFSGDLSHRSPLQIEIENDEYFEDESEYTL